MVAPISSHSLLSDLQQPRKGFRYGIDSFLLARFAKWKSQDTVCDLGAGSGILSILALQRGGVAGVTAVEIQDEMVEHLLKNRGLLNLDGQLEVFHGDWRNFGIQKPTRKYSVVICNPPYQAPGTGRPSPDGLRHAARHEVYGGMTEMLDCVRRSLSVEGRFYCVYPPSRLEELFQELQRVGLKAQRMAAIHPYRDRRARHMMVEAVRSPVRELKIEAPVIVYRDPDHYESDIEAYVGPKRRR